MQSDGGVAGDGATDCTFTYSVFDLEDETLSGALATELTPKRKRLPKTTYIAAGSGSWALAAFRGDEWSLLEVYEEIADTSVCEE